MAWPYDGLRYDRVDYPAAGPHKDKRLYIASRLGSEGVLLGEAAPVVEPAATESAEQPTEGA